MNIRLPQNAGNFLTSWEPVSFSKRTLLLAVSYLPEGRAGAAWLLTKLYSFVALQLPFTSSMLFTSFYCCIKYISLSLSLCLSVSSLHVASGSVFSSDRQHAAVCVWWLLQRVIQCMTTEFYLRMSTLHSVSVLSADWSMFIAVLTTARRVMTASAHIFFFFVCLFLCFVCVCVCVCVCVPSESLYHPAVAVSAVPPQNVTPCATEHLVLSARSDLSSDHWHARRK